MRGWSRGLTGKLLVRRHNLPAAERPRASIVAVLNKF
jgi:hypothetical protein